MKDKNNKYNGKVIQTKYKGYHFRSRTEARWAVFFDKLGVKYEYEPEGFELPNGKCYLPDFYLPLLGGGGYFEVKPDVENEQEWLDNLEQLAKLTGKNCFILNGVPDYKFYGKYVMEWDCLNSGHDDFIRSHYEKTNFWAAYAFCTVPDDKYDYYCSVGSFYSCLGIDKDFFMFDFIALKKYINKSIKDVKIFNTIDIGFSQDYIEAVNYSRAFRFDIDKLHL
jgi:hypothetical protein